MFPELRASVISNKHARSSVNCLEMLTNFTWKTLMISGSSGSSSSPTISIPTTKLLNSLHNCRHSAAHAGKQSFKICHKTVVTWILYILLPLFESLSNNIGVRAQFHDSAYRLLLIQPIESCCLESAVSAEFCG